MKTTFATLAAVLVTLCFTSTALAETPAPAPGDAQKNAGSGMPQQLSSEISTYVVPPRILTPPKDVTVYVGSMVKFEIKFIGVPTPAVVVYCNGVRLNYESGKYMITCKDGVCTLLILHALPEDGGIYTFKVENAAGETSANAILIVETPDEE